MRKKSYMRKTLTWISNIIVKSFKSRLKTFKMKRNAVANWWILRVHSHGLNAKTKATLTKMGQWKHQLIFDTVRQRTSKISKKVFQQNANHTSANCSSYWTSLNMSGLGLWAGLPDSSCRTCCSDSTRRARAGWEWKCVPAKVRSKLNKFEHVHEGSLFSEVQCIISNIWSKGTPTPPWTDQHHWKHYLPHSVGDDTISSVFVTKSYRYIESNRKQ